MLHSSEVHVKVKACATREQNPVEWLIRDAAEQIRTTEDEMNELVLHYEHYLTAWMTVVLAQGLSCKASWTT